MNPWYVAGMVIGTGLILWGLFKNPQKNEARKQVIDLDATLKQVREEIQNKEWQYEREELRQLARNARYPKELPVVLANMEKRIRELVEIAAQGEITSEQLEDLVSTITPEDKKRFLEIDSYEDARLSLFIFQSKMDANGIGLAEVKAEDSAWMKLAFELEELRKSIPDQDLQDHIRDHLMALDGVYTWKLYGCYLNKTNRQSKKSIAGAIQANFFRHDLLTYTNTRIVKRIDELLSGDEPRWTAR